MRGRAQAGTGMAGGRGSASGGAPATMAGGGGFWHARTEDVAAFIGEPRARQPGDTAGRSFRRPLASRLATPRGWCGRAPGGAAAGTEATRGRCGDLRQCDGRDCDGRAWQRGTGSGSAAAPASGWPRRGVGRRRATVTMAQARGGGGTGRLVLSLRRLAGRRAGGRRLAWRLAWAKVRRRVACRAATSRGSMPWRASSVKVWSALGLTATNSQNLN